MLKKMTISNLNLVNSLEEEDLLQVGGSICDMPLPKADPCDTFCTAHCGLKQGSESAHASGQDFYQS